LKSRFTFFIFILLFFLCGCSSKAGEEKQVSKSAIYFDTFVTITVYGTDDEKIIDDCFSICDKYEKMFSKSIESSDVSKINRAKGEAIAVSPETIELIEKGIYYGDLSKGLFDITIAPVSSLWDFHGEDNIIPDAEEINEAISHVSYKNIVLDKENGRVRLTDKEAKIDLGGIAKGYIADKLKEQLISKGVSSALINLGGNIEAVGKKPDGNPFRIGIKKPFKENEILEEVFIDNNSVASSGVYERFFYKDDILYHHILDPKTGYPVESDLYGASVICNSSIDADALGTICILMGYEKAKEMTDALGVKVIWAFAE